MCQTFVPFRLLLVLSVLATGGVCGADESEHWSFQPIADPPLPIVKRLDWSESPVDRFILARLEAEGLVPAERASRTTLLRRVTMDLTGLPPTPDEIAEFLADDSPNAYGRLVDRLLASPRYGERWGRHWLDVARYADSNGLDENRAYVNAYNYRDYVIGAFNRAVSFDRFLKEQLAGDLLPNEGRDEVERLAIKVDRILATGLLAIGPKGLREVDGTKMEMDIIDDQVATVSKAFMSLTFECARCHDHKFDPIATDDYYALAGVFKSTRTMTQIIDARGKGNGFWLEQSFPRDPAAQIRFNAAVAAHQKSLADARAKLPAEIAKIADVEAAKRSDEQKAAIATFKAASDDNLKGLVTYQKLKAEAPPPPATGMAMSVTEGAVQNLQVHIRGSHLNLGDEVRRGVPSFLDQTNKVIEGDSSGRLELAEWLVSPEHPLTSRVIVNRVWRWHFGRGLVSTPDNFGLNGDTPSHPGLLDWLARDLMRSGWSLKRLHRQIVLSRTYQQACRAASSSTVDPQQVDPTNQLLWHFPRQRLDAEQVRDSVLFVGGQLDESLGGSLLTLKPRDYVTDAASFKHLITYDNRRRSVYQPIIRNKIYGLFRVFDFPTPSLVDGDRSSTTVPAQALLLMNSPLVQESATNLAATLMQPERSDAGRVAEAYLRVLGRQPSEDETRAALSFVRASEPTDWRGFVHALIVSNEFLYVE